MNEHKRINEMLTDFALGQLSQEQAEQVESHLAECSLCSVELKRLQSLLDYTDKINRISIEEQACETAKLNIFETVENENTKAKILPIKRQENIWRNIMKNPITKFAAAAIVIIALMLILQNNSVNIVSPAFAFQDVIDAMQKAKWSHTVMTIVELNSDNAEESNIIDRTEGWQSVDPLLSMTIENNGKITCREEDLGKTSTYDPESNIITEEYKLPSDSIENYTSLSDMFRAQIADINERFEKVKYEESVLDGQPVTVIKVDYTSKEGLHSIISIMVDPERFLPQKMVVHQSYAKENKSGKVEFLIDYPDSGPRDIYEAGAPRNTEVVVVDKRGNPETIEALKPYKNARQNIVSKYIMISTFGTKSRIEDVVVMYMDDRKERQETHYVFKPGDAFYEMWPVYSAAMGTTFDSLLQWSRLYRAGSVTIHLYDGRYEYGFVKDDADKWTAKDKEYFPDYNPIGKLAEWGWPFFSYDSVRIENEYSQEHGLLCFERKTDANIENDILIEAAQRLLYYIDPQHDYILVRQEKYGHRAIKEKPSINEIKFDPNEIPSELFSLTEVVEIAQTDTGQWYPKKIKYHSRGWNMNGELLPLRESHTRTILLKTELELPADIFNPDKVIPESSQIEPSLRLSYDEIVKETIEAIDSRPDWPTPKELVEAYWQARNVKDYDTMSLYWPGSATWNENVLANEKPVEYVFGEVEYSDYGGAYVPYAAKSYYL